VLPATQGEKNNPIGVTYDKLIWRGLRWAAGEIHHDGLGAARPVTIRGS
jgi:hypothetical protein